jgi:ABC-type multidrug transport system fused ATPase/permease subunit
VVGSEWPWLLLSFVLLTLSVISQLVLPHFQGKIIDKVIPLDNNDNNGGSGGSDHPKYDRHGFVHYITIYVFVMLAQGAISTLYSALFTLISRRLKFTIRNALFEQILQQDVAYFDGTESGRLISRLTNDLDLMMSPIQSSLKDLLTNVLILLGGMGMCFAKSYRLSMLAFVTVGPISYLWEVYAIWSKGLAREMLAYWYVFVIKGLSFRLSVWMNLAQTFSCVSSQQQQQQQRQPSQGGRKQHRITGTFSYSHRESFWVRR